MTPPSSQTVLVTGANGYIAAHIIQQLLERGYHVRGTVRSEASAGGLRKAFSAYSSQLSIAEVPDITKVEAYENAFAGDVPVTGILHTASPFVLNVENNTRDLLEPAINGAVGVLKAAARYGKGKVHRVVSTASFASIVDVAKGQRPGYTYDEKDWNPMTYDEAAKEPNGTTAYCASKALAEKAQWDWIAENKPSFTLATICPPWVFGPHLPALTSTKKLNESSHLLFNIIDSGKIPDFDFGGFADVRVVAAAHIAAFEKDGGAGQRFLVGSHFDYQSAVNAARETVPELQSRLPVGDPGANLADEIYVVDGSKAGRVLGLEYISLRDSMKDSFAELLAAEKQAAAAAA